jgi:hypothetical protein
MPLVYSGTKIIQIFLKNVLFLIEVASGFLGGQSNKDWLHGKVNMITINIFSYKQHAGGCDGNLRLLFNQLFR